MPKKMKLADIRATINEDILLRKPKPEDVESYGLAMENGSVFPPIVLGFNKKEPDKLILVDGLTRLLAAESIKLETFEVIEKEYASPDLLLFDMWRLNQHGVQIQPVDRDNRIRLLAQEPFKWTQVRIAKDFALDQSSVSRIVAFKQTAGTPRGDAKSRKVFKPMTGQSVISAADRIGKSLRTKSVKGDLAELCYPGSMTDKPNPKNAKRLDVLKELYSELKGLFDYLQESTKPGKK